MSSLRGRANHKLYLARILLAGWREALRCERLPALVLSQAYFEPVREHLIGAYGWFLLAVIDADAAPALLPRRCADLPRVLEGRAIPGEIAEFRHLEAEGWLAELLREREEIASGSVGDRLSRHPQNLAVVAPALPGPDEVAQWAERLETLFDRMGTSLDEF